MAFTGNDENNKDKPEEKKKPSASSSDESIIGSQPNNGNDTDDDFMGFRNPGRNRNDRDRSRDDRDNRRNDRGNRDDRNDRSRDRDNGGRGSRGGRGGNGGGNDGSASDRFERRNDRGRHENIRSTLLDIDDFAISLSGGSRVHQITKHLDKFKKANDKTFKDRGFDIEFIELPANTATINIDTLAVTMSYNYNGKRNTIVHVALLAPAHMKEKHRFKERRSRGEYSFTGVPSEAYDEEYAEKLTSIVSSRTNTPGNYIGIMSIITIPYHYDLSDESKAYDLLNSMITNLWYRYNTVATRNELRSLASNLVDEKGRKYEIVGNINTSPASRLDFFGITEPADISVELAVEPRGQREDYDERNIYKSNKAKVTGEIRANIDLIYVGADSYDRNRGYSRRDDRDDVTIEPLYNMVLNITDICSNRDSLGWQLMVLANARAVLSEDILIEALRPSMADIELRDPVELLCEQEDMDAILDKYPEISNSHEERNWRKLMYSIIQDTGMWMQLIVPVSGQNSQLMQNILDAVSSDNDNSDLAYDTINNVLDAITNGKWDGHDLRIGHRMQAQMPIGYYDHNGEKRSLSSISRFNLMTTYGKDNVRALIDYDNALDGKDSTIKSNASMESIIDAYTRNTAVYVERADVIVLNEEWLKAIDDALYDSGVDVNISRSKNSDGVRRYEERPYAIRRYSDRGGRRR